MFRRKQPEVTNPPSRPAAVAAPAAEPAEAAPVQLHSFQPQGAPMTSKPPTPPLRPDLPRRTMDAPAAPAAPARRSADTEKKLIVGREISLSGAITACDKLVVEGTVEANLTDAGSIEIAEGGLFKGSAEVDEAEIAGHFQGELTARQRLVIRATGKVTGSCRYAKLVVEAGGEMSGTVDVYTGAKAAKPSIQPVPSAALSQSK